MIQGVVCACSRRLNELLSTVAATDVVLQRLGRVKGASIESQCGFLPSVVPRGRCPIVPVRLVGRGGPEHGLTLLPMKVCPPLLPLLHPLARGLQLVCALQLACLVQVL